MVGALEPHEEGTLVHTRRIRNGTEGRRDHSGREHVARFHSMTFRTNLLRINMAALRIADFSRADSRGDCG